MIKFIGKDKIGVEERKKKEIQRHLFHKIITKLLTYPLFRFPLAILVYILSFIIVCRSAVFIFSGQKLVLYFHIISSGNILCHTNKISRIISLINRFPLLYDICKLVKAKIFSPPLLTFPENQTVNRKSRPLLYFLEDTKKYSAELWFATTCGPYSTAH